MSEIRTVSYANTSMEEALKEARKISSKEKGNEAIVDLGDGRLAIVSVDENEEQLENISANNDLNFEDKVKNKLQENSLNTSAKFNPKIMEFSVQESKFFGVVKGKDKNVNYTNKNTDLVDNKISDTETKSKNEFSTLKDAENAAKSRTGLEAVVFDDKTKKFYLVKVSQENLNKYTELDDSGNRVFKPDNSLDSKLLDIENTKGKKIVSFVVPDKVLGVINTDNVLRRSGIEDIENLNLNKTKESKIDVNTNSIEKTLKEFSKTNINTDNIKDFKSKILVNSINELKDPSFISNLKTLVKNSDALFLNTSASEEEKAKIKSELEQGFKDLEKALSTLSKNPSDEEISNLIKNNPDLMKNIMTVKFAAEFSGADIDNGNIGNILLERNRIQNDLKSEGKENNFKELYKRLPQSSNLSNQEKIWLSGLSNKFLEKNIDSKINSGSSTEVDLSIKEALDVNKTFIDELKKLQKTVPSNDKAQQGIVNYLLEIQQKYKEILEEKPSNATKIAVFSAYMNKVTETMNGLKNGDKEVKDLINVEKAAQKMFSEYDNALNSVPIEDAKKKIITSLKEFVGNSVSTEIMENLLYKTESFDKVYNKVHEPKFTPRYNTNPTLNHYQSSSNVGTNVYNSILEQHNRSNNIFTTNNSHFNTNITSLNFDNNFSVFNSPNTSNFSLPNSFLGNSINNYGLGGNSINNYGLGGNSINNYGFGGNSINNYGFGGNSINNYGFGGNSFSSLNSPLSGFNTNHAESVGFNSFSYFEKTLNLLDGVSQFPNANKSIVGLINSGGFIIPGMSSTSSLLNNSLKNISNSQINSSAKNDSLAQKSSSPKASDVEAALAANAAYGDILDEGINGIERRAESLEDRVSDLYENFDASAANIVTLLEKFRGIISDAENEISDIKVNIKRKLSAQLNNIMSISDTSKRRKLLDKLKEMDNELFVNSKEVQIAMKSYMEKSEYHSSELKADDAKKVLESYNKVLESYNSLKDEEDPEKFLDKLEQYNDNLKILTNILNNEAMDKEDDKNKFKLLDSIF